MRGSRKKNIQPSLAHLIVDIIFLDLYEFVVSICCINLVGINSFIDSTQVYFSALVYAYGKELRMLHHGLRYEML